MRLILCLTASLFLSTPSPAQGETPISAPLLRIHGQVLDNGRPVPGAELVLLRAELPLMGARSANSSKSTRELLTTNSEGQFEAQIPSWRRASIFARKEGRLSSVIEKIDASNADSLRLELHEGQRLNAELRYRRRKPGIELAYRLIRIPANENAVRLQFDGSTDKNGVLTSEPLPPGTYQLKLGAAKYRLKQPAVLRGGATKKLSLIRAITLSGRIVENAGMMSRPLAGVRVELMDAMSFYSTISDVNGTITIPGLEKGPGATLLLMPGTTAGNWARDIQALLPGLDPRAPAPQFQITLPKGRELSGQILAAKGKPAKQLRVLARCLMHTRGISHTDLSEVVMTDADGRYRFRTLQGNTAYEVLVLNPSGEAQLIGRVEAGPETKPALLEPFQLGTHRIRAELALAKGLSADQVELRIYGPKRFGRVEEFSRLVHLGDGSYLSPSLPQGEYVVFAVSKQYGFARGLATIRKNESPKPVPCRITMSPPRVIEGVVRSPAALPLPGQTVMLLPAGSTTDGGFRNWHDFIANNIFDEILPGNNYLPRIKTDGKGRFRLTCYESSGNYDLYVSIQEGPAGPGEQGNRIPGVLGRQNPIIIQVR
ncbi:MAG: hypothetical protein CSA62_10050 [Planctomycetota bacterium]|nr:MAG: hypothetical protein CSA62_10050 [Planctomycetota bacterium]